MPSALIEAVNKGESVRVARQIAQLMSKEMDRRDFLKYSGGVLLAVIGITGLINTLVQFGGEEDTPTAKSGGYGSTPYGK